MHPGSPRSTLAAGSPSKLLRWPHLPGVLRLHPGTLPAASTPAVLPRAPRGPRARQLRGVGAPSSPSPSRQAKGTGSDWPNLCRGAAGQGRPRPSKPGSRLALHRGRPGAALHCSAGVARWVGWPRHCVVLHTQGHREAAALAVDHVTADAICIHYGEDRERGALRLDALGGDLGRNTPRHYISKSNVLRRMAVQSTGSMAYYDQPLTP